MLAQNFKSAADLKISKAQQSALIKVLGRLERGELKHSFDIDTPVGFNMSNYFVVTDCGTVGCIAGWADATLPPNERFMDNTVWCGALRELFHGGDDPRSVTPEQAAIALRSYLTTGDAKWHEAVA